MGFTPNLTAAVWFGMDRPITVREGATGGGDAAPVWGRFMKRVYYGDSTQVNPDSVRAARGLGPQPPAVAVPVLDSLALADSLETQDAPPIPEVEQIRGFLLPIPDPWPFLPGLISRQVDSKTGLLASRWCPADRAYTEVYVPGTEPTDYCDASGTRIIRDAPESPKPPDSTFRPGPS
jgi:penicillin-binding protein 1A